MRIFVIIFSTLLVLFAMLPAHSSIYEKEQQFKTYETFLTDYPVFHCLVSSSCKYGELKFPGYIIGIEKSPRKLIADLDENKQIKNDIVTLDKNIKIHRWFAKRLDDPKRAFISHIAEYKTNNDKGNFLYNAYSENNSANTAYLNGLRQLDILGQKIQNEKFTHIFLYSMGWNTDQAKSIKNYNDLFIDLKQEFKEDFKPLFIGISWPSEWPTKIPILNLPFLSYGNKANDADEIGIVIVNKILRDILVPLKKEQNIPLILVGHSFGTRILSRAVFTDPKIIGNDTKIARDDIDLVIGLQPAFSSNRFVADKGLELSPYHDFSKYAKKFIYTWSIHDKANPLSMYLTRATHIGGKPGYKETLKYKDIFEQFKLKDSNTDLNICNSNKISIVDASNVIHKRLNFFTKAHSDIYKPEIAKFIYDAINNIGEC